jgi:hypothetical protein
MKLNYKHAFVILAMAFLFASPAIAAANAGEIVIAQDIGEDFFFNLIENGAEIVFSQIDEQGTPIVLYGQLGIPDAELGLDQSGPGEMYDGCVAMALIATQGEILDYILDLVGADFLNMSDGGSEFIATQFDEGGFDFNSIFDLIGTEFNLLINVYFDLTDAQAQTNMAAVRTHLHSSFGFNFAELLNLRIDENFFPPEMGVELPFDGLNVFVYQVTNPFEDAVNSVLGVMDDSGFMSAIDPDVFTEARASAAGLLAIPDFGNLQSIIDSFGGDDPMDASSFMISQMPDIEGPIAVAAAGYIGDQLLSTTSNEIKIFEDLLGKDPLTNINPLDNGQSLIGVFLPEELNVTSYSPEDEALNQTFHDTESNIIFWNATAYTDQSDYIISFEEGAFPPLIVIDRTFSPATLATGGTVTVNVGVHNSGTDPIYNLTLDDTGFAALYPDVTVSGTQSTTASVLNAGAWLNVSYSVTFTNEGGYLFPKATVHYDYEGNTYTKSTHIDGYTVSADIAGLLQQMISDGMPYTGIMIGVVGLGAIVNIGLMARGRGGGGSYQV